MYGKNLTPNPLTFKGKTFDSSSSWAAAAAAELLKQTANWEKLQNRKDTLEFLASASINDATANNNIHSLKSGVDMYSQLRFNGLFNAKGVYSLCS